MTDAELAGLAIEAAKNALPLSSDFPVGAALLCADGRVFTGCNVESPSLLQVFCAERVAMLAALSAGARRFEALAIHAPRRPEITPCGLCRQMLAEFSPETRILIASGDGKIKETSLKELLPEAYTF